MRFIEILTEEHNLIRQVLDLFTLSVGQLEMYERPPTVFFDKAVDFTRNFADNFHHFKEEHVMFVLLAQKKSGLIDAQIDVLRHQHDRGRNFTAEISKSLKGYATEDEIATTNLVENLASYVALLRRHIHKEDYVFYPMAQQTLTDEEKDRLLGEFRAQAEKAGGLEFARKYRTLIQEMGSLIGG
ncbi:MAG: hemerythrin domain-containing protein [Candidatus Adiutricales bacterium]